jgi:hypothetical protein
LSPQGYDAAVALLFLIALLALVKEGFAAREHEIHHAISVGFDIGSRWSCSG